MKISQLKLVEIVSGELEKNMCLGIGDDVETDIFCTLIKMPDDNNYQIDVITLSEAFVNTSSYYLEVRSKFRLKIIDNSTQIKTENDFMAMANLIQLALGNVRVLLYEKCKTQGMPPLLTNIEPISILYNKLTPSHMPVFR